MNKLLIMLMMVVPAAMADSGFFYEAPVLEAELITVQRETDQLPEACLAARPGAFNELLAWDIGCGRPQLIDVAAWQVTYSLEDRQFSTLADHEPGETIRVRIGARAFAGLY